MDGQDIRIFPMEDPSGYVFILLNQKTDDGYYDAIIISEEDDETYLVELCEVQPTDDLLQDSGQPMSAVPSEYLMLLMQVSAEFSAVASTMPEQWDPELSIEQNMSATTWVEPV